VATLANLADNALSTCRAASTQLTRNGVVIGISIACCAGGKHHRVTARLAALYRDNVSENGINATYQRVTLASCEQQDVAASSA